MMLINALLWLLKLYVKGGVSILTLGLFLFEHFHDHPVVKFLTAD